VLVSRTVRCAVIISVPVPKHEYRLPRKRQMSSEMRRAFEKNTLALSIRQRSSQQEISARFRCLLFHFLL
jgi:hypothetical protein